MSAQSTGKAFNHGGPFQYGAAATPSNDDGDDYSVMARGLQVDVAGTVVVKQLNGTLLTVELAAKVQYNIPHFRVHSTGTTATGITSWF